MGVGRGGPDLSAQTPILFPGLEAGVRSPMATGPYRPPSSLGSLSKLCFLAALVFLVWCLWPAAQCASTGMDLTELQTEAELRALEDGRSSDVVRVESSKGFLGRFFGNFGVCYDIHPISANPTWKYYGLLGSTGGFVLFILLGRVTRPRRLG